MRSVYAKVLFWCLGSLLFSMAALVGISWYISGRDFERQSPFPGVLAYLLDDCARAWEKGGKAALEATLQKQRAAFPLQLRVADARGIDLITGEDLNARLGATAIHRVGDHLEGTVSTADGRYRAIALVSPPAFRPSMYAPFYLLVLFTLAGLCWLLAVNIASPLRQLARTVDRFGAGDLDARLRLQRGDEIGHLADSFNHMAERLQLLLTAERRLLQDISHELRSPLARLSFAAELVRTAPDRDRAVDRLNREISRLTVLVSGLLEVARAEGESAAKGLQEVNVDALLDEIMESCDIEAGVRHCRLERHGRNGAMLNGHPELLRRAIENVLSNAVRHAPESTPIDVEFGAASGKAVITIRDQGPGVPDDTLNKIFTPFFRVDESRDSSTGGLGLGLAIAQRAILLHHGEIRAENAHPGLRVVIELPLAG